MVYVSFDQEYKNLFLNYSFIVISFFELVITELNLADLRRSLEEIIKNAVSSIRLFNMTPGFTLECLIFCFVHKGHFWALYLPFFMEFEIDFYIFVTS